MTEKKYTRNELRRERGLYRAPDGVLLARRFFKFYRIPADDENRFRRESKMVLIILFVFITAMLVADFTGASSVIILVMALIWLMIMLLGTLYTVRGLTKVRIS